MAERRAVEFAAHMLIVDQLHRPGHEDELAGFHAALREELTRNGTLDLGSGENLDSLDVAVVDPGFYRVLVRVAPETTREVLSEVDAQVEEQRRAMEGTLIGKVLCAMDRRRAPSKASGGIDALSRRGEAIHDLFRRRFAVGMEAPHGGRIDHADTLPMALGLAGVGAAVTLHAAGSTQVALGAGAVSGAVFAARLAKAKPVQRLAERVLGGVDRFLTRLGVPEGRVVGRYARLRSAAREVRDDFKPAMGLAIALGGLGAGIYLFSQGVDLTGPPGATPPGVLGKAVLATLGGAALGGYAGRWSAREMDAKDLAAYIEEANRGPKWPQITAFLKAAQRAHQVNSGAVRSPGREPPPARAAEDGAGGEPQGPAL